MQFKTISIWLILMVITLKCRAQIDDQNEVPESMWTMYLQYGAEGKNGDILKSDRAGPYYEGNTAILNCVIYSKVTDGTVAEVIWWRGTEVVDDKWSWLSPRRAHNQLVLRSPDRTEAGQQYTCKAFNISKTVTIDMYLQPKRVLLYASKEPVHPGTFELQCRILGTRPAPTFIWKKDNEKLEVEQDLVTDDLSDRGYLSTVTITTTLQDNGLNVTCCTDKRTITRGLMCSEPHTLNIY